jgi:pyridoxine 4-dehydrogenase
MAAAGRSMVPEATRGFLMASTTLPGGTFTLAGGPTVPRMGYGAMQLAGPGVFGPPVDRGTAIAVLREAAGLGIRHIDTADFYGPHVTNEIIREALAPYPGDLHIVTKVGAVRDARGGWLPARSPADLRTQVHDNLRHLGLDVLDVVNLRVGGGHDGHSPEPGSIAEPFEALAELRRHGLIRQLGISTVDAKQVQEAQSIAPVVCVQNFYNVAHRDDDDLIDSLAARGIAYVPYFPLGGFSPLQSAALTSVAVRLGATPLAVALAWLLQRSPNILLIPGTSSVVHLRDNVAGAALALSGDDLAELAGL